MTVQRPPALLMPDSDGSYPPTRGHGGRRHRVCELRRRRIARDGQTAQAEGRAHLCAVVAGFFLPRWVRCFPGFRYMRGARFGDFHPMPCGSAVWHVGLACGTVLSPGAHEKRSVAIGLWPSFPTTALQELVREGRVERGPGGRYRFLGALANETSVPTATTNA